MGSSKLHTFAETVIITALGPQEVLAARGNTHKIIVGLHAG